jgi:DNA polymerase III subunit alpha
MLSEIREKMVKGIQLNLDMQILNRESISDMHTLLSSFPGNCQLRLKINDTDENISVDFFSKKFKISPSNEFIQEIEKIAGVNYKVLT